MITDLSDLTRVQLGGRLLLADPDTMKRIPVKSSMLISVGYTEVTATLELEFKDGKVYRYFAVPRSVYVALMSAPSLGSFVNAQFKDAFPYEAV